MAAPPTVHLGIFLLAAGAIVASAYALVRHVRHPMQSMLVPIVRPDGGELLIPIERLER